MKNKKFLFSLLSILFLFGTLQLSSCSSSEIDQLKDESPSLQFSVPSFTDFGPVPGNITCCNCYNPGTPFETFTSIFQNPKGAPKGFRAEVTGTSTCSTGSCSTGGTCNGIFKRYILFFEETVPGNYLLSDFQDYSVTSLNGSPLAYQINTQNNAIMTNQPFKVQFTWNASNLSNPTPTTNKLQSGGICIIGVITDPSPLPGDPIPVGHGDGNNG